MKIITRTNSDNANLTSEWKGHYSLTSAWTLQPFAILEEYSVSWSHGIWLSSSWALLRRRERRPAALVKFVANERNPMNREEIETKIKEIVAEHMSIDITTLTMDTNFQSDLKADSLDIVELTMTLEEQFEQLGDIPDEDAQNFTTIKQVVEYLHSKLGTK